MSSRRCGKGKGYRQGSPLRLELEAQQWMRERHIAQNLVEGCNAKSVRHSPRQLGFKVSTLGLASKGSRMPFAKLVRDGGGKRCLLPDSTFYSDRLDKTGGAKAQSMIRTGTTPPRKVLVDDEDRPGKKKLIRISAKPRYAVVGLPGSLPKDGGKD